MLSLNATLPDADDIALENEHFLLVQHSLACYPDLQTGLRPNVHRLNQRCASLKYLMDGKVWAEFSQLLEEGNEEPENDIIHFPHHLGDGLHYITNNPMRFKDGHSQLGDTSEGCILFNLELILNHYNIPNQINDLWNLAYPDDPMHECTVRYLLNANQDFIEPADLHSPENLADALRDLQSIQCQKLAAITFDLLQETGLHLSYFLR